MIITLIVSRRFDTKTAKSFNLKSLIIDAFNNEISDGIVSIGDDNTFSVCEKHNIVKLQYEYIKTNKAHIINISTEHENISAFCAMEKFYQKFSIIVRMNEFNIIKAYDGSSQVLCSRLYKPLSQFERVLRKLVYEIVVKTYGSSWYKETVENLRNNSKEINHIYGELSQRAKGDHNNQIECALEEMDYESLKNYLFVETPAKSISELLVSELSDENVAKMTKDEIIERIQNSRPQSLWNRLFSSHTELSGLQTDFSQIHMLRNKVMHAKSISYDEYKELNNLLNKWIMLIENAIKKNEIDDFSPIQNISIIQSLSLLGDAIKLCYMPSTEKSLEGALESIRSSLSFLSDKYFNFLHADVSTFTKNIITLSSLFQQ